MPASRPLSGTNTAFAWQRHGSLAGTLNGPFALNSAGLIEAGGFQREPFLFAHTILPLAGGKRFILL